MRILVSYFFGDDMIPLGYSCVEALRKMGHQVSFFNSQTESIWEGILLKPVNRLMRGIKIAGKRDEIGSYLPIARENFKRRELKKVVEKFRPDQILVIKSHSFVNSDFVTQLKTEFGVRRIVGWCVDGPLESPGLVDDAKIYDEYFCSHTYGYDASTTGIKFLPVYGMDFERYKNLYENKSRTYRQDIVLVGGSNPRRVDFVNYILDQNLQIYGKWGKVARSNRAIANRIVGKGIWGEALINLYNESRIVLNITGCDPAIYGGLNMRVFDVPATGSFLLTDYAQELEESYKIGSEIECFRCPEELADKLRYYLTHESQREAIALRGYRKALRLPTIGDRMKAVFGKDL